MPERTTYRATPDEGDEAMPARESTDDPRPGSRDREAQIVHDILRRADAEVARLRAALTDLLDWAENDEGEGRLRRTEALQQARDALGVDRG